MTKASDNEFPKLIFAMQTSAPAAPSDSDWKMYAKANGIFARSSNTEVGPFGTGGGGGAVGTDTIWDAKGDLAVGTGADTAQKLAVAADGSQLVADSTQTTGLRWASAGYDINVYTGGDITFNNTTLSAVTGPTDLVVAAATGDVLFVGMSARCPNSTAQSMTFDFATIVSASPVNYVSAASGTPVNVPTPWYIGSADQGSVNGPFPYIVQAGDISGGNVTLRLYARSSGSRVIAAAAAQPLITWVKNFGH